MSSVIKIDKTKALQILTEKLPLENLPVFKKGESILAEILTAKGNQVTLKTLDGRLFSANMLSCIKLTGGENVELIVKENTGGHIILQLFATEEGTATVKPSFDLKQYKDKAKTDVITHIFEQLNIKPTPAKVQAVLNIMKDYPSLNVKAAVFFTVNNIPANEPNIAAVLQLAKGESGIGEILIEIADALVEKQAKQANPKQSTKIIGNVNNPVYYRKNGADKAQNPPGKEAIEMNSDGKNNTFEFKPDDPLQPAETFIKSIIEKNGKLALDRSSLSYIMKEALPLKNESNAVKTALWPQIETPDKIEKAVVEKTVKRAEMNEARNIADAVPVSMPHKPKISQSDEIILKILSMFANLDVGSADELKKASLGNLKELNFIKEMLRQSDIKNKDDYIVKLSELVSREKLASDINRYICLHIPVVINRSVQTAELYIYRKNKKGSKIDQENTVVYLGLDMHFMGRVETVIQIDKKNVSLTFKLESEKAMSIVKNHTTKLFKELQAIGYKLVDTKIIKLNQKTTVVDAEEELVKTVHKKNVFIDYKI